MIGLDEEINGILKKWDPVGIEAYPDDLATEYIRYIPRITKCLNDLEQLESLLWQIGSEEIGTHQESNADHKTFVREIASELFKLGLKYRV